MKRSKLAGSAGMLSLAALTLVACGKNNNADNTDNAKTASRFPSAMPKKEAKQGGSVRVALETNTPFTGIFLDELSVTSFDAQIASPGEESLFATDDYYKITDDGPATMKLDKDKKTITITIKKGVKWSDGKQVTAKDMNIDQVNKKYNSDLNFHIPTLIPAPFGDYFDKDAKGYNYNLKKANEILDKAGYKKKGKWRVQPNGKPLKIKFLGMAGSAVQEPIIQNYIQQWHKIGLNVSLYNGRLIEINSFYDKVQNDDPGVDMFMGSWSLSSEPSPADIYNEGAPFNFSRFVTPENTKLLNEIDSQKAFDHKYRVEKFHEWQEYMNKEAYVVPVNNSYEITAVNKKLTGYTLKPSHSNSIWYEVAYAK